VPCFDQLTSSRYVCYFSSCVQRYAALSCGSLVLLNNLCSQPGVTVFWQRVAAFSATGGSHRLRMQCLHRPPGHTAAHRRGAASTTARALHHGPGLPDWLNPARIGAAVLACILSASACSADASQWPTHVASEQLYEQQLQRRKPRAVTNLPTSREAGAMRGYDRDLFTPDAWEGMLR
jgi:hypothetical protein